MHEIRLVAVTCRRGMLVFSYRGAERAEAWIENVNKHYPHILSLDTPVGRQEICIDWQTLRRFLAHHAKQSFRLCLCNARTRFAYSVSDDIHVMLAGNPVIRIDGNTVLFEDVRSPVKTETRQVPNVCSSIHGKKEQCESFGHLPISLLDIGSCFSRSIFKSDDYFNPQYKSYFRVQATLFHNSYISLFSDPIPFDVSGIEDLHIGDAGKYAGVEFDKNLDGILRGGSASMVVSDLYVDASVPVVRVQRNAYLTYNKYISESIFKRHLSSCEIIYPGTEEHETLFRSSLVSFRRWLETCHIRDVVLVGGRLCRYKIDETTRKIARWEDKASWIAEVNRNWDIVDRLFLEELPDTIYLDKRSTSWMSDSRSPILGGASPSHYQSGYYKELFQDFLAIIGRN
ncbi:MAG: hypothetical protein IJI36_15885 [Kiritimatiellae bacterium]|nr:hypothetical protein [Kiritimatiellia bacterium]